MRSLLHWMWPSPVGAGILWVVIALLIGSTLYMISRSPGTIRAAWQYESDPIGTSDIGDCTSGYRRDHWSTVRYDRTQTPNVFYVDGIYYGGRKPDKATWTSGRWRRDRTIYREWQDPNWVTVTDFDESGWRSTGSACSTLDYWLVTNNVTLNEGALVKQKLKFKYYVFGQLVEISGKYHKHFLQCQEC